MINLRRVWDPINGGTLAWVATAGLVLAELSPFHQERCTCTCCQMLLMRCQMRVSQQRAVIGSPLCSFWVSRV